ncbi:MAG TPA: carboxypeptidase-like regulatory domain-containing protein [Longimicrobium sp.]
MRPIRFLLPLLAAVLAAAPLGAQPLRGQLVGDDGRPLAHIPVVLLDTAGTVVDSTATSARGVFRLQAPGNGRYEIQARGADGVLRSMPVTLPADIGTNVRLSLHLRAEPAPARDSVVLVPAPPLWDEAEAARERRLIDEGYFARRREGVGAFLAAETFAERRGAGTAEKLRGLLGLEVARPAAGGLELTVPALEDGRRCRAALWVDGVLRPAAELDRIDPARVDAVEAYGADEVPPRFRAGASGALPTCAAVVLWLLPSGSA